MGPRSRDAPICLRKAAQEAGTLLGSSRNLSSRDSRYAAEVPLMNSSCSLAFGVGALGGVGGAAAAAYGRAWNVRMAADAPAGKPTHGARDVGPTAVEKRIAAPVVMRSTSRAQDPRRATPDAERARRSVPLSDEPRLAHRDASRAASARALCPGNAARATPERRERVANALTHEFRVAHGEKIADLLGRPPSPPIDDPRSSPSCPRAAAKSAPSRPRRHPPGQSLSSREDSASYLFPP